MGVYPGGSWWAGYHWSHLLNVDIGANDGWVVSTASSDQSCFTIAQYKDYLGRMTDSSRVTRLRVLAALCITSFPVADDPVKLILSMPG